MASPSALTDFEPDSPGNGAPSSGTKRPQVGAPRFAPMGGSGRPPRPSVKQGAIARFEAPIEVVEPAGKKARGDGSGEGAMAVDGAMPMGKSPRPLAPENKPAGLPDNVNLPPRGLDEDMKSKAGPSVAPPDRGRAPPKDGPVKEKVPDPEPPTTKAPYERGKIDKEEEVVVVPRYERADPEFESSDDEDEEDKGEPAGEAEEEGPRLQTPAVAETTVAPDSGMISAAETMESASLAVESEASRSLPPVNAGPAHMVSAFAPPPPSELQPSFVVSPLADSLRGGRFSIRCIEGIDIKRKNDPNKIPRLDPYLKFKIGAAEKHPYKTTATKRKQDNMPKFDDEVVFFDILDPKQFVFNEDIVLSIEIYNKSTFKDECLGAVTMSAVRFMKRPFFAYEENVPVYLPGETKTSQKLHLEFVYEEARSGMFIFTLFEARGLRKVDPMGKQDPFVQFSLGEKYNKKSKTVKDSSTDPYFGEEDVLIWTDGENWINDLRVDILDDELGVDKPIGFTQFCLLPYMNMKPDEGKEDSFDLFYDVLMDPRDERSKKEIAHGELSMKVQYLPAGKLDVACIRGTNLAFPETYTPASGDEMRMDPYVKMTLSGQAVDMIKRSPVDKDGGSDPVWDYSIAFDLVDQYLLDVEVFHQVAQGKGEDILLGSAQVSLLSIFRAGKNTSWVTLKQRKANGGLKEMGNVNLTISFVGPASTSYPLHRPGIDSFDDAIRKRPEEEVEIDDEALIRPPIDTVPSPEKKKSRFVDEDDEEDKADQEVALDFEEETTEFTEQEVKDAFKFIDLDNNNFVGASEIRHILVCMGEMITDEEIDMMIKMVDLDGDGQVSFTEFRTLVLHPHPGDADMHKAVTAANDKLAEKERQALTGKSGGMDLSAFQRQKEMILRESKKKAFHTFVVDNETDFDSVKSSYYFYLEIPKPRRLGGRVNFDLFCQTLRIEPITEYKLLFNLFDSEEMGDVDMREVLLTMMNFVEVGREERLRFSFEMYDEVKTGYISRKEVEEILRGNHMLSSVGRKADTIMKQATTTDIGSITLPEFIVVSKKFPNILLPGQAKGDGKESGTGSSASRTNGSRSGSSGAKK